MKGLKNLTGLLSQGIEEIILLGIILLNIVDFAEMLSPDWDYAKKILSWTALGYLLYKSSPTNIFFGHKNKKLDVALILSYFLMSIKIFTGYAQSTINSLREKGFSYWGNLFSVDKMPSSADVMNIKYPVDSFNLTGSKEIMLSTDISNNLSSLVNNLTVIPKFPPETNNLILNISNNISSSLIQVEAKFSIHRWLNMVLHNADVANNLSIILGGVLLLFLAIYSAYKMEIKSPSMLSIFHGNKEHAKGLSTIPRTLSVFLAINFFFIAIFNLFMEWLAIAIDAPILVVGLFFYLLVWIKHHDKFNSESFIFKVGNFGTKFYQDFIMLLKTKRGILLGISGMLVLHLLTDAGNFLIPYSFGIHDSLYFEHLGPNHTPVFSISDFFTPETSSLFMQDIAKTSSFAMKFMLAYIYLGNLMALLSMLLIPAILWYLIFMQKHQKTSNLILPVYFSSLTCFIMSPVFNIGRVTSNSLIGVDIQTQSILNSSAFSLIAVFAVSLSIGIIIYLLSFVRKIKNYSILIMILSIIIYFANYIFLYFTDILHYYADFISFKLESHNYFVAFYFAIFMIITMVFYIGGFTSFLYELVKS
ncbi:MAG: hypothetical protein ACQESF_04755 [Nanobdellota archaeon]